jgi:hypothetical protein
MIIHTLPLLPNTIFAPRKPLPEDATTPKAATDTFNNHTITNKKTPQQNGLRHLTN